MIIVIRTRTVDVNFESELLERSVRQTPSLMADAHFFSLEYINFFFQKVIERVITAKCISFIQK